MIQATYIATIWLEQKKLCALHLLPLGYLENLQIDPLLLLPFLLEISFLLLFRPWQEMQLIQTKRAIQLSSL
jgi:hypothetical protein